jgi:hypothetical protein
MAAEVRVFPLMALVLKLSPYRPPLLEGLAIDDYRHEIHAVPYELQRGGQMLCIKRRDRVSQLDVSPLVGFVTNHVEYRGVRKLRCRTWLSIAGQWYKIDCGRAHYDRGRWCDDRYQPRSLGVKSRAELAVWAWINAHIGHPYF